jgi:hypothetical protein
MTASPGLSRTSRRVANGRHRLRIERRQKRVLPFRLQPRLVSQLAVTAGVSGALSTIDLSPVLQSLLLMIFAVAGIGSAALCWLNLPGAATVAGVIGLSLAGVIAFATSLVWLRLWYPVPGCLFLSLTVAAVGMLRLWRLGRNVDTQPPVLVGASRNDADSQAVPPRRPTSRVAIVSDYIATALLLLAIAIWLSAVPGLRGENAGQWGLLATPGGLLLLAATAVAVTGFVVAIAAGRAITAGIAIIVVIVVERATVPVITEIPIYSWTYRHIGVVDYIMKHHTLAPTGVDVYNQWPGFFATMAWFSSITGLDSVTAAHWFAPIADTLVAALVAVLALSFGSNIRAALTAALLAQLVNWVGQDYYSPQSIAFILCATILVLLSHSRRVPAAGYASVPIFAVLVATHQLTPVWVCGAAVALAVCRHIRPGLAAVYVFLLIAYLLPRYSYIKRQGGITGFNLFDNSRAVGQGRGSDGRLFSLLVERGLSISLWLSAAICLVIVWRRSGPYWPLGIMAFSPLLMLFVVNYGNESILRVFLYSLLTCSVLVAPVMVGALTGRNGGRRLLHTVGYWLVSLIVMAAGLQGYYAGWSFNTISRNQLEQSRWLLATNRAGTAISMMAPPAGWPERSTADFVKFALVAGDYDKPLDGLRDSLLKGLPTPEAIDELESGDQKTYIIIPRQAWAYNAYIGLFPPGALARLVEQLNQRSSWVKILDDSDTLAFVYTPP